MFFVFFCNYLLISLNIHEYERWNCFKSMSLVCPKKKMYQRFGGIGADHKEIHTMVLFAWGPLETVALGASQLNNQVEYIYKQKNPFLIYSQAGLAAPGLTRSDCVSLKLSQGAKTELKGLWCFCLGKMNHMFYMKDIRVQLGWQIHQSV